MRRVGGADGNCGWKCDPFTFPSEALPHMELLRHVRQIENQTTLSQLQSLKTTKSLKLTAEIAIGIATRNRSEQTN